MKKYLFISIFSVIVICIAVVFIISYFNSSETSKPVLRVMTYSSFANVFGPGDEIKKKFEEHCNCHVRWLRVSDSTFFAQRLRLREDGFKTDVVMGLDQISLATMNRRTIQEQNPIEELPWKKLNISKDLFISPAGQFASEFFVPYNWSPMTFIARKEMETLSLQDLLSEDYRGNISLPSPRTSTVGLQFYYWIWFVLQDKAGEFLVELKKQLYGLPPSWSTSYALFQRGHVDLSFSYLSSLLYHKDQDQKDFYEVPFQEDYPFQVEVAGVSGFCTQCELAHSFVAFLLQSEAQDILFKKNYMFPVVKNVHQLDTSTLNFISYNKLHLFFNQQEVWVHLWD